MSKKNTQFRDTLNEIYKIVELLIVHETRQLLYLTDNEGFRNEFYGKYQNEFRELFITAIQQAQFYDEIKEIIDFIRQNSRYMFEKGNLPVLFEEMETAAVNKAGEIAAAQIKSKPAILESAVFRAVNFGFVETFAAGAFRLFNSFQSGDTKTIRPTIETKSSGFPPEAKVKASAGHDIKSAVAGPGSVKPGPVRESAGSRALRLGFVETFVAGFWRLVKWFKPDNAQTIRPEVKTKLSTHKISTRGAEHKPNDLAKNTEAAKAKVATSQRINADARRNSVLLEATFEAEVDGEEPVINKSGHSNAPELAKILEVFPKYESRLKAYEDLWRSRSKKGIPLNEASVSLEIKRCIAI